MNHMTAEELIAFEAHIQQLWETGELPFLVHLCGGNEKELISIFSEVKEGDWIFSSHRAHYHYLLAGGPPERLETLIRNGRSMFVFDKKRHFLSSSVLGGTCGIAAGVAWQLKEEGSSNRVWCFLGDGAEEEGHFYESVLFVEGNELPCTFVVEDNDRSVDTEKSKRRGKAQIAWPSCVRRYHYISTWPHAGSGCKHQIVFKEDIVKRLLEPVEISAK
ncbi:MAG: thiamine pyrophosphate-dependent enzyme [Verrucomicrobium sp.]|nr:thiamine pyrophosphate-dependent enzyme [Verrucomicrobium sp.]